MERQEPTLGKTDPQDLHFRPRSHRGLKADSHSDSTLWLKVGLAVVALVLIVMGLIEWNARRQVAALERALTPTPEQRAAFDAEIERSEREDAETMRQVRRQITIDPTPQRIREPLRPGQRCMQGRRLERIEGGWRDLPNEPC